MKKCLLFLLISFPFAAKAQLPHSFTYACDTFVLKNNLYGIITSSQQEYRDIEVEENNSTIYYVKGDTIYIPGKRGMGKIYFAGKIGCEYLNDSTHFLNGPYELQSKTKH